MSCLASKHSTRGWHLPAATVASWFSVALCLSLAGAFDSGTRVPAPLGLAAVLPVLAFAAAYRWWPEFRRQLLPANPAALTLAQAWRVGGIVFVMLWRHRLLPGAFALPAGWGDIAVGASAPLVAWGVASGRLPRPAFVAWNLLGLADLVTAVTLGVLSSAGPVGILAGAVTTRIMGTFPLGMIPTFFVPLLAILHLVAIARTRPERDDAGVWPA